MRHTADASQALPGTYDVVTTFDVIHDAVDPLGLLRSIRRALVEDGIYLSEVPMENAFNSLYELRP